MRIHCKDIKSCFNTIYEHNNKVKYYNNNSELKTEKIDNFLRKMAEAIRKEAYNLDPDTGSTYFRFYINPDYSITIKEYLY